MSNVMMMKQTRTVVIVLLAVVLILVNRPASAQRIESPILGADLDTDIQLVCNTKQTYQYDYTAEFVHDVTSVTEAGSETSTTIMNVEAELDVTPVKSKRGGCQYFAEIVEATFTQDVDGVEVMDVTEEGYDTPFLFEQDADGVVDNLQVAESDSVEAVEFKRGIINSMNFTMQSNRAYSVRESDNTGTYDAQYRTASSRTGATTFTRTRTQDNYLSLTNGRQVNDYTATNQTARVTVANGAIARATTASHVVVDQPTAVDPAISDHYYHETVDVNAEETLTLEQQVIVISPARSRQANAITSGRAGAYRTIELTTELTQSTVDEDNAEAITHVLKTISESPDHPRLLNQLTHLVRTDSNGVAQVESYVADAELSDAELLVIASALIGVGTPDAQTVVSSVLSDAVGRSPELTEDILVTASVLQRPTAVFVTDIEALTHNQENVHWQSAYLTLGALVNRADDTELVTRIVGDMEENLRTAQGDLSNEKVVYMRALGNAGQDSSIDTLTPYMESDSLITRVTAIKSLRKMESEQVEELLMARSQAELEDTETVAIMYVMQERSEHNVNSKSALARDVIFDHECEEVVGNNRVNVTFSCSVLVEAPGPDPADETPFLVDASASVDAQIFSTQINLALAQLLTEEVSETERRFFVDLQILGNSVGSLPYDRTFTCSHEHNVPLWDPSPIPLVNITTPPIPVGPLLLTFTIESTFDYGIDYHWLADWCDVVSIDFALGMTPYARLDVDGYGTLTVGPLRGGIGIAGTVVGAELPIEFTANLHYINGVTICFTIDLDVEVMNMELYGWGQYWFFGWKPKPKPQWTLFSFQLWGNTYELLNECSEGPTTALLCIYNVDWWDGSTIDPSFDGANCYVAPVPSGESGFATTEAWYVTPNQSNSCPAGTTATANGCRRYTLPPTALGPIYPDNGGFTFLNESDTCPPGSTALFDPMGFELVECSVSIPSVWSFNDLTVSGNEVYGPFVESCDVGVLTATGCWLGDVPDGREAFYLNNAFYYGAP